MEQGLGIMLASAQLFGNLDGATFVGVPADWCPCGVLRSSHAMACDNWQFHYVFIYYVQIGILTYLHSASGDSTACINVMAEE